MAEVPITVVNIKNNGGIMLMSMKELEGYDVIGTDGEVGEIDEIYFDNNSWTIRYIVTDTGTWLSSRRVLLSPHSVSRIDKDKKEIHFNLSKDKIKNSPGIDTEKTVSRQHESDLAAYYGWPIYWAGSGMEPIPSYIPLAPIPPDESVHLNKEPKGDPFLRGSEEVIGYNIKADDGDIGHVEDFIFDNDSWMIRYMVVDTKTFLAGKKVLVALPWIKDINWMGSNVRVGLKKESIENSPEYDPDVNIDKDYEERLHQHYDKSMFW